MSVLGLMSGTSLDGLDMALCEFAPLKQGYNFKITKAKTVPYDEAWRTKLKGAENASAEAYFKLNAEYGKFMADRVKKFLGSKRPELLSSHGHTVFHQPKNGFSTQLGCGATLAAQTGISTVCDLRNLDVALGGQGAPLVPIGDKFLFSKYEACLNIGGIANISYNNKKGKRMAHDICAANILFNMISLRLNKTYDKNGLIARSGKVDNKLLSQLNGWQYYKQKGPKSLGRELLATHSIGPIAASNLAANDLLATATEHVAAIIGQELDRLKIKNVLVTGGGAFNVYLVERLKHFTRCKIIIPGNDIINFKEALIFAFLGYLRFFSINNSLSSVTGASIDNCGGAMYIR